MDDDQDFGAAQPLVDVIKGAYKKVNDYAGRIPTPGYTPKDTFQPDDTHKRLLDEANKSYIHPAQTAAQKKGTPAPTNGKSIITKVTPRKR